MRVSASKLVSVSYEKVWAELSNHETMAGWAPGLKVSLDKPGTTERNGVGAVRRIAAPGPAPAIVEEVTAFEPGRLGYKALGGVPFRGYHGEVTLKDLGAQGTEITWVLNADSRLPGPVEQLPLALVNKVLLAMFVRSLR